MEILKDRPSSMGLDIFDGLMGLEEDSRKYNKKYGVLDTDICQYCNDSHKDLVVSVKDGWSTAWVHIEKNQLCLVDASKHTVNYKPIAFCPMCGRRL